MLQFTKKLSHALLVLSFAVVVCLISSSVGTASAAEHGKAAVFLYRGEAKIELTHAPFVENGVAYLPLRETMTRFGLSDDAVRWASDGSIDITLPDASTFHCSIGKASISSTVGDSSPYLRENATRVALVTDYAMRGPALLKAGAAYLPYEFFHQMSIISPSFMTGFSVRCEMNGVADSSPLLLPLTLNDVIVLSRRSTDGESLTADSFSPFLYSKRQLDNRTIAGYWIDSTYYVTLETSEGRFTPWLHNSERNDAINIAVTYYSGLPWWGTD